MADRTSSQTASRVVTELWWLSVVEAIIAILFGIVATFWPSLTLVTLVYLLSAFVIAVGLTKIARGLMSASTRDTWWMTLITGLIILGGGVYLARHPEVSFATFILIVGISFIAWGVIDVARAFVERASAPYRVLSYISGIAGVIAGVVTLLQPAASGVAFVWVLGVYALIYGIVALVDAVEAHRHYVELVS